MPDLVQLKINGSSIRVRSGSTVAAGVMQAGLSSFRRSVTGEPRGPLCGMGICMECRVTINGQPNCRSCQILCQENMEIVADV